MASTVALLTAEYVAAMPESAGRFELVRGALRPMMAPLYDHGAVVIEFGSRLHHFVRERDLGDIVAGVGFVFERDPDTLYLPDLAFIQAERRPSPSERRQHLELVPDLVVEVLSPSDTVLDVADKVRTYLRSGVRLIWVLNPPGRSATVHTPDFVARTLYEEHTLDGRDVLPGFAVRVGDLFA